MMPPARKIIHSAKWSDGLSDVMKTPRLLPINRPRPFYAGLDRWQGLKHREIPEEQLDQQRDVADGLDIQAGNLAHQPVG